MAKLTVGMATFNDFYGVVQTIQDLKSHVPHSILSEIELIVVDQNPESDHGKEVKSFVEVFAGAGLARAVYHPYTERIGTSASRGKVVELATAPIVNILDCHVSAQGRTYQRMLEYFDDLSHHKDIYSGPLLTDHMFGPPKNPGEPYRWSPMATHYADHWRDEMWGTWANTYRCPCNEPHGIFSTWREGEENLVHYETVSMGPKRINACPACAKPLPFLGWAYHPQELELRGYRMIGTGVAEAPFESDEQPFEIPGMGLGFFAFMKEHWPGFNPKTWGFGGEELYLHEKFRRNGGRAVCDPQAPWWHRFGRPGFQSYPNSMWYKVRNLVHEFNEMGWSLDIIKEHFVYGQGVLPGKPFFPANDWDSLIADPDNLIHGPTDQHQQPKMVNGNPVNTVRRSVQDVYAATLKIPRDFEQHMPILKAFADRCEYVTEFSKRHESLVALLASDARMVRTHNREITAGPAQEALSHISEAYKQAVANKETPKKEYEFDDMPSMAVQKIEQTDLLHLDTIHHYDNTRGELAKYAGSVNKYIFLRGTGSFGIDAEFGGEGMFAAIREFVAANPEWFVVYHTAIEYGLTILSRVPEERPTTAIVPWPKGEGPGTELKNILQKMGVQQKPNCLCGHRMREMDANGVEWCRENLEMIVKWIEEGANEWGWGIKEAGLAMLDGLAFKIGIIDPWPNLVRECIHRAEMKERKRAEVLEKQEQARKDFFLRQ